MRRVLVLAVLLALLAPACAGLLYFCFNVDVAKLFNDGGFRPSFFGGFVSVGGFLFSLKSFILMSMKTSVYDSDDYAKTWKESESTRPQGMTYYGALQDLSTLLFCSIVVSFVAAVTQITIGFIGTWWSAGICLGLALSAIYMLAESLLRVQLNLRRWFRAIEKARLARERARETLDAKS